ncbi:MAG: O-antigen ligase family protein [Bacteroidota bacterium]|nr:O-antigen ligase family protein [Bacteroidota bacterium]
MNRYTKIVAIIGISSFISLMINPYPFLDFSKQILGFLFIGITWYGFIKMQWLNKEQLLKRYVQIAVFAAFLCIPEQILHVLNIHITPLKGAWLGLFRCYSICDEPFFLALLISPVFIYYMGKINSLLLREKLSLIIIAIALFFTFSGAAWLGILIYFLLTIFTVKSVRLKIIYFLSLIAILSMMLMYHGTQKRIFQTIVLFKNFPAIPSYETLETYNSSSRSIYLNAVVTWMQFKNNPLLGGGLGSHHLAYQKHVLNQIKNPIFKHYNASDGASGALRWLSEMGLIGIFILGLLFRRIRKTSHQEIKNSKSVYWLIRLIHAGNFFSHGSFYWLFIDENSWFNLNADNEKGKP